MIEQRELAREGAVLLTSAVAIALAGPFGTFALPLGERLLAWIVFMVAGYGFFRPVVAGADALTRTTGLPRWVTLALACAMAGFPVSVMVAFWFAWPQWRAISLPDLFGLYPFVVLVGAGVTAVQVLAGGAKEQPGQTAVPPAARPSADASGGVEPGAPAAQNTAGPPAPDGPARANALLDLLPTSLGRDVLCIRNEDHYVRVYTDRGEAMILMRLRDAVAALSHVEGAQVHRSWWVARRAVTGVGREGRAVVLALANGARVPVARNAVQELRQAGWF